MKGALCNALLRQAEEPNMAFFTGDLGFRALEPLRAALGERFINAGLSEQNMISVAAAMARDGWQCWCYSIAPFCFARPFEQIRNDVCLHDLPVKLLGNGGGYGYGVQGPTHHAVDDYGVMLALPFMRVFVPVFNEDVASVIQAAAKQTHPAYIRISRGELPAQETAPAYAPWRQLLDGPGPVVVAVGPLAGAVWDMARELPLKHRPALWVATEFPLEVTPPPPAFSERLERDGRLLVVEEHIRHGGAGAMLASWSLAHGIPIRMFRHCAARGLALDVYGSQAFLRKNSLIDPQSIHETLLAMEAR
jgi:transketolase